MEQHPLLRYYNLELDHLKEMGSEFAREFPKIAARLGMSDLEVADPYVERLLEGVAFLAARVHLKLDAELPRFTQALLEIIYPHYLAPTPSMVIAQLQPQRDDPNLAGGSKVVPRGSPMHSVAMSEDGTACEFRTAQDVTLWPIEVAGASYFSFAPDLPLNRLPFAQRIRGGVRIRLRATAGLKLAQTGLDRLTIHVAGRDDVANRLCELCLGTALGVMVLPSKGSASDYDLLPATVIRQVGFDDDQAVLPQTLRSFEGYRLLQEYFSLPQRFRFFELSGLGPSVGRARGEELEIVILLGRGAADLESLVDASNVALFCTPAINLFPKRADRINVSDGEHEYHVVADRTRPMDFEVYSVTGVKGHGVDADEQDFLPFYTAHSADAKRDVSAYFTVRREPRLVSSAQKRRGPRSSYLGSEVFLALVDPAQAPFAGDLRQLSVQTLCTNRDLVLQMPVGSGRTDAALDISAPVSTIRIISGPSRPYAPLADGAAAWRAINHLSLNYLSLIDSAPGEGARALRELLILYASGAGEGARKQIEGIRSVGVGRVVRRLPGAGPLAFGRGVQVSILVQDMAFEGASAFVLGSVLNRYLARHVSINSFVETVLTSESRGEINRWGPQWGARPTL